MCSQVTETGAARGKFQLFDPLSAEEYTALEADIRKRGVQLAVEVDEDGEILDGHHRLEIAQRLGIDCPTVTRHFDGEAAKCEHVIMVNLARRHLDPIRWGQAFQRLLETRGISTGRGSRNDKQTSATVAEVAEDLGVPERTARHRLAQAKAFEELQPSEQGDVRSGDKTLSQIRREQKEGLRRERREANARLVNESPSIEETLETAKFATIVIDPPWSPEDEGESGEGLYGRGAPPYATMTVAQIASMPVGTYADDDCHLYMWITNRSLFKGETLLTTWGFRYVTCLTWVKPSIGLGAYFRGSSEQVLFGIKGSQPLQRHDVGTWFAAPRGPNGHSSKPTEFYDLVESCSPGPYLDIFAREQREGWTSWGAEV